MRAQCQWTKARLGVGMAHDKLVGRRMAIGTDTSTMDGLIEIDQAHTVVYSEKRMRPSE